MALVWFATRDVASRKEASAVNLIVDLARAFREAKRVDAFDSATPVRLHPHMQNTEFWRNAVISCGWSSHDVYAVVPSEAQAVIGRTYPTREDLDNAIRAVGGVLV